MTDLPKRITVDSLLNDIPPSESRDDTSSADTSVAIRSFPFVAVTFDPPTAQSSYVQQQDQPGLRRPWKVLCSDGTVTYGTSPNAIPACPHAPGRSIAEDLFLGRLNYRCSSVLVPSSLLPDLRSATSNIHFTWISNDFYRAEISGGLCDFTSEDGTTCPNRASRLVEHSLGARGKIVDWRTYCDNDTHLDNQKWWRYTEICSNTAAHSEGNHRAPVRQSGIRGWYYKPLCGACRTYLRAQVLIGNSAKE